MKISVNWIKEFTDINLSTKDLVNRIGAQLGEVESVEDLSEKYQDIIVSKVISCEKHPNADKLSVCLIDDGKKASGVKRNNQGLVQVVCGAPNIRAGLTVAWLPPGSVVPSTFGKEQFKLEVRPLRGIDSNGMIASASELDISDDHSGILVIDKPAKPGQLFSNLYDLNDTIIEIENKMFTHRPDLFGILGIAREIAGIQGIKFKSPKWYKDAIKLSSGTEKLDLNAENRLSKFVPRLMLVPMAGVHVQPSPITMQSYLSRVGLKPINNIVDITNFVMVLTAQPLHAYDYDKLCSIDKSKTTTIITRKPKQNEKIKLLNGKTIQPNKDSIMIASKKELIGVGGVMGGSDSEVDFNTKNIVLECANFDMYSIRRSSMENGLFTDAVTRFNKGQSPWQNDRVICYAAAMVQKIADGNIAGKIIDLKETIKRNKPVKITTEFVNSRLGLDLTTSEIVKLLVNVEFEITRNRTELSVKAPFWRTDIEIPEDIVEEVGRLYGYDHLPLELPIRTLNPAQKDKMIQLKNNIRNILASGGANEVISYSFIHGDLITKSLQDKKLAYRISNALSPDLQYYRLSLTPSLLDKVHSNAKAGYDEFAIFEIGKTHNKKHKQEDGLPIELEKLALVYTDSKKRKNKGGPSFYVAKKYIELLADKLNLSLSYKNVSKNQSYQTINPFDQKRTAEIVNNKTGEVIGIVGEYDDNVASALKLPDNTAGFEISLKYLIGEKLAKYKALSKFPSTHQDISLKVPDRITYSEVETVVSEALDKYCSDANYNYQLRALDIYRGEKSISKNYSFRITLSHQEKTLVTEEVNKLLAEVSQFAENKVGAIRV